MRLMFLILLFFASVSLRAENLIRNPECEGDKWQEEFRAVEAVKQISLSRVIEPATWNHCLKLELREFGIGAEGKKRVGAGVLLGGDSGTRGFVCKPDTSYRFRIEIKGDASRAMINFYQWNAGGKRNKSRTSVHLIRPQKEWTTYRGTFKTAKDSVRAALMVQFWGDEKLHDFREKIGQFILIDKISVEEADDFIPDAGKSAGPPRKLVAAPVFIAGHNEKTAAVINGFRDFREDKQAGLRTEARIYQSGDRLILHMECFGPITSAMVKKDADNAIWLDDLVEIFFAVPDGKTPYRQFVISAGGGRWMGNGTPAAVSAYSSWKAEVRRHADRWSVEAEFPFASLGYAAPPADGDQLRFNLCRQHPLPGTFPDKPDYRLGNRWGRHRMFDNSSLVFGRGSNCDTACFATLFFRTMKPFCDKLRAEAQSEIRDAEVAGLTAMLDPEQPGTAFAAGMELGRRIQYLKLSREPFLLAQISPATDPSVPFFPRELGNGGKQFKIRAAVNEQAPLALALANMGAVPENYRVFVNAGWARLEPSQEWPATLSGLESTDGTVFPAGKITLRRGVAIKDDDTENRGRRLDLLAKLDEAGIIEAAPREAGLLWLTFDCSGVKPGIYSGRITVIPLNGRNLQFKHDPKRGYAIEGAAKHFPLELEVLPITLPESAQMPLNAYARPLRNDQMKFMAQYDCFMHMVTPWYFTFRYKPDGRVAEYTVREFFIPQLKRVVDGMRENPDMANPKIMVGYSVYPTWKQHLAPKFLKFDSPEYWNAWRNFLIGIDKYLKDAGVGRREYTMEIFDEPQINQYPIAEFERAHAEYKKAMPDASAAITSGIDYIMSPDAFDRITGNIDIWIFTFYRTTQPDYREKMEKFQALPGKKSGIYACGTSMRQDLYRYYRLLPWNALEAKCDFVSLYQLFPQNALSNDLYKVPFGDVAYVLPETIIPSIRLENLRIGLTDVKYLKLLEHLVRGKHTPAAKAARDFLARAAHEVYVVHPHDSSGADRARTEAIEHILKINGSGAELAEERAVH